MLLNSGAREDSWESYGLQGNQTNQTKEINLKGNQSWSFNGRTDPEAEAPILSQPDANSWVLGKDSDDGKGGSQEEKGTAEDEMIR